jgi:hypothetical protein
MPSTMTGKKPYEVNKVRFNGIIDGLPKKL